MLQPAESANLNPSVVSSVELPGVSFQVVDYHWEAGTEILHCAPEVVLRWRMHPYRVKARGWAAPGEEVSFGQLMLHPADVPTHGHALDEAEDVRTLVCRLDRDWLGRMTGDSSRWNDSGLQPCLDLRNGDIDHAMRRLMRELLEPGFATTALAEGLAMSIAVDVMRHFEPGNETTPEARGCLSPSRLRQIRDYIESFTEGCPTLSDVAQRCNVSVAHLRRLYKLSTGQTLHDFIEEARLRRAQTLLLESNLQLKVISYKLGFCHPSAFSFAFKKLSGESPRDFRQRCGKDAELLQ